MEENEEMKLHLRKELATSLIPGKVTCDRLQHLGNSSREGEAAKLLLEQKSMTLQRKWS